MDQRIRQVRLLQLADCLAKQQCRNQPAACLDRRKRLNLRQRKGRVSLGRQQPRHNQRKLEDSLALHLLHHNLADYLAVPQPQHNHRAQDCLAVPRQPRRRLLPEECSGQHRLSSPSRLAAGSLAVQTPRTRPCLSLHSCMFYSAPNRTSCSKLIYPVAAHRCNCLSLSLSNNSNNRRARYSRPLPGHNNRLAPLAAASPAASQWASPKPNLPKQLSPAYA